MTKFCIVAYSLLASCQLIDATASVIVLLLMLSDRSVRDFAFELLGYFPDTVTEKGKLRKKIFAYAIVFVCLLFRKEDEKFTNRNNRQKILSCLMLIFTKLLNYFVATKFPDTMILKILSESNLLRQYNC